METNDELKEISIKNHLRYDFDDIFKIEDFNFDNFLMDEKSYEYILIYDISYNILIGAKPLYTGFHAVDEFIRVYDGNTYLVFLALKNMMSFTIQLDAL